MQRKGFLLFLVSGIIFMFLNAGSETKASPTAGITGQAALVMDANTGEILYQKNSNTRFPAASTVKVLTAVIAAENLSGQQKIPITKRAAGITPTKLYMTEGVKYKVDDLLKCLLMNSANDATVALAEAMAATEFEFSVLMNNYARQLGAKNSFFLNATGLPEGRKRQYSTVNDLCVFMRKALAYPKLIKYMKLKTTTVKGTDNKEIKVRNHNKMLSTLIGKTGYTRRAQHCFLGLFSRGDKQFIVALQGSRSLWKDLEYLVKQ